MVNGSVPGRYADHARLLIAAKARLCKEDLKRIEDLFSACQQFAEQAGIMKASRPSRAKAILRSLVVM